MEKEKALKEITDNFSRIITGLKEEKTFQVNGKDVLTFRDETGFKFPLKFQKCINSLVSIKVENGKAVSGWCKNNSSFKTFSALIEFIKTINLAQTI